MGEGRDTDEVISSYPFSEDETASEEEPFVCGDCGREFSTERGLNIHRGQQHDQTEE
jgi:hypothetical protein